MTQTIVHTAHKPRLGKLTRQVIARQLRLMLGSFPRFTSQAGQINLYRYQQTPAAAILDSVRRNLGLTFVLILPRTNRLALISAILIFILSMSHTTSPTVRVCKNPLSRSPHQWWLQCL